MGKQPIISDLFYVMPNGPKDSQLLYLLVYHSIPNPFLEDIQVQSNSYVIIHILYICSVPDAEISNMQLR